MFVAAAPVARPLAKAFIGQEVRARPANKAQATTKFAVEAKTKVCSDSDLVEGDRKIVDVDGQAVIVTRQNGKLFAVSATCPHLGLPMKKGKIENCAIVSFFHKSTFALEDGKVLAWSESFMGLPGTGMIGKAIGNLKGGPKNLATYPVSISGGDIYVD
eukprot:tig00000655_g2894.t1